MIDSGASVSLIPAAYGAPWNSSVWTDASWRTNEWQTTTSNDAEMPEHSCDTVNSSSSSAEPRVPKYSDSSHRGSTEPAA
jgi:hypothetical protein